MKQETRFLDRLLPGYARRTLLIVLIFNCTAYYIPKLLSPLLRFHTISTSLDDRLPLVPGFVFIYVLAYVQWFFGYCVIARDSRERCRRAFSAEMIAKAICLIVFLCFPTRLDRPTVEARDFSTWTLSWIYRLDTPVNLFPSIHCLASWLCFREALGLKRMPRWYAWAQLGFTLLVFASVLLVKQHIWPDILGGVAAVELGLLLRRLFHADRLMAKIEQIPRSSV